jgi:hypothetical protein
MAEAAVEAAAVEAEEEVVVVVGEWRCLLRATGNILPGIVDDRG